MAVCSLPFAPHSSILLFSSSLLSRSCFFLFSSCHSSSLFFIVSCRSASLFFLSSSCLSHSRLFLSRSFFSHSLFFLSSSCLSHSLRCLSSSSRSASLLLLSSSCLLFLSCSCLSRSLLLLSSSCLSSSLFFLSSSFFSSSFLFRSSSRFCLTSHSFFRRSSSLMFLSCSSLSLFLLSSACIGFLLRRPGRGLLVELVGGGRLASLTSRLQQSVQLGGGTGEAPAGGGLGRRLSSSLPTAIVHGAACRGRRDHPGHTGHGYAARHPAVAVAAEGARRLGNGEVGSDDGRSGGVGRGQRRADVVVVLGGNRNTTIHDVVVALLALRLHGAHFANAEVLRCCWREEEEEEEEEEEGDPCAPALDEAGSGCKAHCCCCCWLQEGLLVTIGRGGAALPGSGWMPRER
ncbi:hypothetical protein EYF80_039287 [Liparis tanakae]|uniref:Uncharacterized protein n=1 Tax=Liparis tanakae TaxID=230148 RepID=A0A4Z2GA75_9TELE|nr:hypothetical protein EYF80_039287 [Liparis tanakae]